jgi:hypothetical protein
MAGPTQTIMFTAMPRGLSIDPARLPVSVLVSPRLTGATRLGVFPDWLDWTQTLKTKGMKITFAAGGATHTADIDTGVLQPALWREIFDETTLVDEYTFDDFSQRLILSYPNRATLTLLKSRSADFSSHCPAGPATNGRASAASCSPCSREWRSIGTAIADAVGAIGCATGSARKPGVSPEALCRPR